MKTSIINFKADSKVKKEAQATAKKLGLSLSDVLNVMLGQFTREKELHISLEPTPYLNRTLQESKRDIAQGYVSPAFDSSEDAIAWLNDPKACYENGRSV